MPLLSEPVRGEVRIRAARGLELIALAADGSSLARVQPPYEDGVYTISLPAVSRDDDGTEHEARTHWFLLTDGDADGGM